MKSVNLVLVLILCLILCLSVKCLSQEKNATLYYSITVKSAPSMTEPFSDLYLHFDTKGTYTFIKDESVKIPTGYTLLILDPQNGNSFDLLSSEPHYFSISRSISKRFVVQLKKIELISSKQN